MYWSRNKNGWVGQSEIYEPHREESGKIVTDKAREIIMRYPDTEPNNPGEIKSRPVTDASGRLHVFVRGKIDLDNSSPTNAQPFKYEIVVTDNGIEEVRAITYVDAPKNIVHYPENVTNRDAEDTALIDVLYAMHDALGGACHVQHEKQLAA